MPYGDSSMRAWVDWKSVLFGGAVALTTAYVGLVLPSRSHIEHLEGQVARLATAVDALTAARGDVDRGTTLLGRLEAQAGRLAAAEATMARVESLGERVIATTDRLTTARHTLEQIDQLHQNVAARAATVAEVETSLAKVEAMTTRAAERADRLLALEQRLIQTSVDVRAADAALVRLTDLAEMLSGASGTVGQLQRFVVEVMLLEPAVGRAMRALEPVVEFTRGEQKVDGKNVKARSASAAERETDPADITELARTPSDENR